MSSSKLASVLEFNQSLRRKIQQTPSRQSGPTGSSQAEIPTISTEQRHDFFHTSQLDSPPSREHANKETDMKAKQTANANPYPNTHITQTEIRTDIQSENPTENPTDHQKLHETVNSFRSIHRSMSQPKRLPSRSAIDTIAFASKKPPSILLTSVNEKHANSSIATPPLSPSFQSQSQSQSQSQLQEPSSALPNISDLSTLAPESVHFLLVQRDQEIALLRKQLALRDSHHNTHVQQLERQLRLLHEQHKQTSNTSATQANASSRSRSTSGHDVSFHAAETASLRLEAEELRAQNRALRDRSAEMHAQIQTYLGGHVESLRALREQHEVACKSFEDSRMKDEHARLSLQGRLDQITSLHKRGMTQLQETRNQLAAVERMRDEHRMVAEKQAAFIEHLKSEIASLHQSLTATEQDNQQLQQERDLAEAALAKLRATQGYAHHQQTQPQYHSQTQSQLNIHQNSKQQHPVSGLSSVTDAPDSRDESLRARVWAKIHQQNSALHRAESKSTMDTLRSLRQQSTATTRMLKLEVSSLKSENVTLREKVQEMERAKIEDALLFQKSVGELHDTIDNLHKEIETQQRITIDLKAMHAAEVQVLYQNTPPTRDSAFGDQSRANSSYMASHALSTSFASLATGRMSETHSNAEKKRHETQQKAYNRVVALLRSHVQVLEEHLNTALTSTDSNTTGRTSTEDYTKLIRDFSALENDSLEKISLLEQTVLELRQEVTSLSTTLEELQFKQDCTQVDQQELMRSHQAMQREYMTFLNSTVWGQSDLSTASMSSVSLHGNEAITKRSTPMNQEELRKQYDALWDDYTNLHRSQSWWNTQSLRIQQQRAFKEEELRAWQDRCRVMEEQHRTLFGQFAQQLFNFVHDLMTNVEEKTATLSLRIQELPNSLAPLADIWAAQNEELHNTIRQFIDEREDLLNENATLSRQARDMKVSFTLQSSKLAELEMELQEAKGSYSNVMSDLGQLRQIVGEGPSSTSAPTPAMGFHVPLTAYRSTQSPESQTISSLPTSPSDTVTAASTVNEHAVYQRYSMHDNQVSQKETRIGRRTSETALSASVQDAQTKLFEYESLLRDSLPVLKEVSSLQSVLRKARMENSKLRTQLFQDHGSITPDTQHTTPNGSLRS
eukprot:TRINITY_DN3173_c0_g1_i1.p1 TRINITY_DN3173_c0_g1~~TRINITY_DN3173_c0_g1_i1.p1  ORF type:complete len:1131 (+),score=264.47 TRINITY_DN3173_c0_g1_i1:58-3450(+)